MSLLTLLAIVVVGCLLAYFIPKMDPPARTIAIVVAVIVLFVALLSLLGLMPALHGQEAPMVEATPTVAATIPVVAQPTVVTVNGAAAAVVPAPSEATAAEVKAVAEQSAENLKAVASGEVSLAEATRDPTSGAPDTGDGSLFWVLSIVFGMVIRPVVDVVVGRMKGLDDRLAGAINVAVLLGTYIGAWALLRGANPGLPQSVASWVIAGFAAAGLGSATSSSMRSIRASGAPASP